MPFPTPSWAAFFCAAGLWSLSDASVSQYNNTTALPKHATPSVPPAIPLSILPSSPHPVETTQVLVTPRLSIVTGTNFTDSPTATRSFSQGNTNTSHFSSYPTPSGNRTSLPFKSANTTASTIATCIALAPDDVGTVYSTLPASETVTVTLTGNMTATQNLDSDFTPPPYCPASTSENALPAPSLPPFELPSLVPGAFSFFNGFLGMGRLSISRTASTVIVTPKTKVTLYTTQSTPSFPGGGGAGASKQTVVPTPDSPNAPSWPKATPASAIANPPQQTSPAAANNNGSPANNNGSPANNNGSPAMTPSATVTGVYQPAGTASTVTSHVVILGADMISAIGASQAVIGGHTYTYGPQAPAQTIAFNGQPVTLGPAGITFGTTTIGGAGNPYGLQIGIVGGLSVTEIGSAIAVISGSPFAIGPDAQRVIANFNGVKVTAGPNGLDLGLTALGYPFNTATQIVTAGGVTLTELGSTLVDIGGSTYTIGQGAPETTAVYGSHTISFGPGGVEFDSTTFFNTPPSTATPTGSDASGMDSTSDTETGTSSSSKKNGSVMLRPCGAIVLFVFVTMLYNV